MVIELETNDGWQSLKLSLGSIVSPSPPVVEASIQLQLRRWNETRLHVFNTYNLDDFSKQSFNNMLLCVGGLSKLYKELLEWLSSGKLFSVSLSPFDYPTVTFEMSNSGLITTYDQGVLTLLVNDSRFQGRWMLVVSRSTIEQFAEKLQVWDRNCTA